jgi:hypothetical protein
MPGFACQHCGFDLSLRVDLLAVAVKAEYPENDLPTDLSAEGICEECGKPFVFEGEMFTHYVVSKIEEEVISPETENYAILEFEVSDEELKEFQELLGEGNKEKLEEFMRRLVFRKDD